MTPTEIAPFVDAVTQVFEAVGSKPPTQLALKAWIQTLREFPFPDVITVLDGWLKRSNKAPAPADLWKLLNDMRTERIEQTAKVEARTFALQAERTFRRDDAFGRKLRALAIELRDTPANDPKDWAHVLWHRYVASRPNDDGSALSEVQIRFACEALHRTVQQANEARSQHRATLALERAA